MWVRYNPQHSNRIRIFLANFFWFSLVAVEDVVHPGSKSLSETVQEQVQRINYNRIFEYALECWSKGRINLGKDELRGEAETRNIADEEVSSTLILPATRLVILLVWTRMKL